MRNTWTKGLKHYMGPFHQSMRLPLAFIGFQIDYGALLAAIPGQPRRMAPERIAARWFNLDHLCPEIREHRRRKSAGHTPTEV
jgi:hypothetical protein